jgi:gliding motility-associated-like protein
VFPIDTTVYTITVGNECDTISQAIEVRVVPQLSLNISTDDVTCNGLDDGQIEVIPIGGSQSGLTYDWQPNLSSGNIGTSLPPNTYTIAVSDAAGCRDTISGTVDQPTPLLAQVDTLQMVNCFGESNGEVTISGQGGTGSYTYALNGPPFFLDSTFINLPAGAYTVYVQDENGCIDSSQQAVVQEPNQPIDLQLVSIVNANCNTAVGEILVQASGGTPGYTYILNGDTSASPLFQNLLPANYLIEVIDANGCNTLLNVVVVQVSDPRVDLVSSQNPSCFGDSSGTATISIADGLAPYIVDALSGGLPDTTLNSPSTITYNNLPAGVYQVNLIDANNCEFLLTFSLENPDSLYGDVRLIQVPLCSYTADGVALINGIGGTPPYLYAIDNGTPDTNNIFSNVGAGILYTLSLEDSLGCQIEQTVSIQGPPPLVLTPIMEPVSCPGGADGRILLTAIGGKRDYEYSLDDVPFGNRLPFGDDSVYYNLLAGDYISIVQDDNGCLDSLTVTVTEPEPLSISPVVITDVDCYGAASGAIDLFGSGGTAPYQFATNLGNFASINRIGGLREGTYTIIMRDINGCTVDSVVNISQPARLTGSITSQPVICYGDSNGVANVIPQGGTPPYRYFWSNTATTQQVFNLPPGTPTVSVTDDNGCMYVLNTEIQEPPQMQFDTTASEDASCFGIVDGQVLATASGGTDTLSYLWSNGSTDTFQVVGAGVYQIIVTDGNGCTIEDSLEVGQPLEIIIEIMAVQQASCGAPTGEIQVEAMGGLGDVTYQWNTEPPQFGRTATGLYGGPDNIYTVRVIDEQGCENTLDATVGVIGEPTADFQHGFEPLDTILFPSYGVQFINRSLNGSSYRWEFGDGDQSLEEHPDHVYPGPGTYTIQLITIDDGFACPDTTEKTLVLLPPGAIYVPNAFTPNGDAHNQGWSPIGIGVIQVESRIYTRWGKLITTLNSMDEKWYGDLKNGGKAPEGVYVYVVNAVLNDGRTFEQHGMVTLFR